MPGNPGAIAARLTTQTELRAKRRDLVRKKTAAMFAGFITRQSPEDNLMGEGLADASGVALAGLEPGTLQILEPGEDIKFSDSTAILSALRADPEQAFQPEYA